jgi:DNA-directed RNA polymerase specialized sigma24 family protein
MSADPKPVFASTHWSAVLQAGSSNSPAAREALAELCRTYWYPLYGYARSNGFDVHSAEDLTQAFFGKLLEKNYLGVADRRRGRFRWFLLTAFKCFLANEWDRSQAQKRGGGQEIVSFDGVSAQERYRLEPETSASPDQLYDVRWAEDLLDRSRLELQQEYEGVGDEARAQRFNQLVQYLPGGEPVMSHAELGGALGISEAAAKQEVYRMRKRFGEVLRDAVAQTVAHPDEVDDEIRYLIDIVCRR